MMHQTPDGFPVDDYQVPAPPHPSAHLHGYTPSEVYPHIAALQTTGLYDRLNEDDQGLVIKLMQAAYRRGQASQQAEKIDNDAVWVDGVGGLEKQPDGVWKLIVPDKGIDTSQAAAALGSIKSEKKAVSSAENGKKGGRPKKAK